ncbi:Leucine-, isoleucine-, valine-, threonine-, and alanine-binding protein [archaeon HR01]|nr:Leucine-, isoleucine-, valine-, threonine-, and alanine-binding protein [archaeon HR01]
MEEEKEVRRYTRRQAISNVAAAGAIVGVGVVAGLGGYFAGGMGGGRVETITQRETVTVGGQTVTVGGQTVTVTQPTTITQTQTQTVTGGRTPPRDKILIGGSISLTGGLAGFGTEEKWALEEVARRVNEQGGVYLLGYDRRLPVELIIYDSKSDIPTVLANLEKLINVDKVDLLVGETGSHIGLAIAPVVEQAKTPIVGVLATTEKIFIPPTYHYLFSNFHLARDEVWIYYDYMNNLPAGVRPRTIVIWEEASDLGADNANWFETYARQYGYEVLLREKYTPGSDLTALVTKTKALNPDVVGGIPSPPDAINMIKISKELRFSPKIWAFTRGTATGTFGANLGADAEFVTASFVWHESLPGAAEIVQKYRQETNRPPTLLGIYYSTGQIAIQAVEWAGLLDRERIRNALASLQFDTVMGKISFGEGGKMNNTDKFILLMQWRSGKLEIIWPRAKATAEPVYPFPSWESR